MVGHFFIRKGYFMTEENTIMERLFHTLDERAKSLNEENGHLKFLLK